MNISPIITCILILYNVSPPSRSRIVTLQRGVSLGAVAASPSVGEPSGRVVSNVKRFPGPPPRAPGFICGSHGDACCWVGP